MKDVLNTRLVLVLGLVSVLAMALSACGGGDSGEEASSTRGSQELSGTVTVWDFEVGSFPAYKAAVDKIDADFERLHPGVTVDRVAQPLEGYEEVYRTAFASHEGPDLMVMQSGDAGVLEFKKGLEVLNDRISSKLHDELTQWPSATAGYAEEGDEYGIPLGLNGFAFYYNKKLFAEAGLPTNFEPETWTDIMKAGEKLQAAGIQPFVGGGKEGWENSWWFSMGYQSENTSEQTIELGEGEIPYTDEAVAKAFGPQFAFYDAGFFGNDYFSTFFTEAWAQFAEGNGAMTLGFWNAIGYWGEFNAKLGEQNVGVFLPPSGETVGTFSSIVMSMPTFAENKDAAFSLAEYEASRAGMKTFMELGGYMPNRTDLPLPADSPVQAMDLVQASVERENVPAPSLVVPAAVVTGPMAQEINQAMQGRVSLEDALQSMQDVMEKIGR